MNACILYIISTRAEFVFGSFSISWEQRKLGEISEIKTGPFGSTLHADDYVSDGVPIITTEHFKMGTLPTDKCGLPQVSENDFNRLSAYTLNEGDIVFSRVGSVDINALITPFQSNWLFSGRVLRVRPQGKNSSQFLHTLLETEDVKIDIRTRAVGQTMPSINTEILKITPLQIPASIAEQEQLGEYFKHLDHLITLHQRKSPSQKERRCVMIEETRGKDLFYEYYAKWITVYKKGAIRKVTMDKYLMTQKWLEKLIPDLRVCDMNRIAYQQLLNDYAEFHERQTTMDFHHQLKGAILDAVDEGLIDRDPTRKAIIKGRTPAIKKGKYLNQFELHTLLVSLDLKNEVNWDYFILLVAKTGMRFSEALALTPKDFDFSHQTLSINKTWDYKGKGGFQPTKNKSSVRKIQIDWQTVIQFSELVKGMPKDQPIFVKANVYNSTVNDILRRYCEKCNIPVISVHGLRHTHASLLLFAGVSIASVARRLGHSSMTTTQKTYLHIIQELENKDIDLVMRSLSGLS